MYGMKENVEESTIDFDTPSISEELSIRHLSSSAFRFRCNPRGENRLSSTHPRYSYSPSRVRVARHCVCVQKALVRKRSYRLLSSCKSLRKLYIISFFIKRTDSYLTFFYSILIFSSLFLGNPYNFILLMIEKIIAFLSKCVRDHNYFRMAETFDVIEP